MYIELHASSAFSFLDGASLPEALVARAAELGYSAMALLDRDGVYGVPRFHLAATRAGLQADRRRGADGRGRRRGSARGVRAKRAGAGRSAGPGAPSFALPLLVASREGYRNLCRLITRMKLRAPKGEGALTLDDLDGHVGGLVALVGRTAINGPPLRRRRARRSAGRACSAPAGWRSSCSVTCCATKSPTTMR